MYKKALKYGLKKGAEQLEIFVLKGSSDIVQLEKSAIFAAESKTITGLGVRSYYKKAVGMATTSLLTAQAIKDAVGKAVSLSKTSPADELFKSLPEGEGDYPVVNGLSDKAITNLPADALPEMAIEAIDSGLEVHEVLFSGSFKRIQVEEIIFNSQGVDVSQEYNSLMGVLFAKAEQNGDLATSWDFQKVRSKQAFDPAKIGENAAKNAVSLLGAKKIKSQELAVVLDPRSTMDTLSTIVADGLSSYEVILGTAYFKDKLGDQITSEQLTIVDNPLFDGGVGSAIFDDEGVPHQKLVLVEDGIAKAFFSDSYCANILGIANTAHASKGGLGSKPHPDLTQVQISPGDWSVDEMIAETKNGLYLRDSALEPVEGSPNISSLVDQGFIIRNGEISHPVKETMIGTTVFDLLKNVDAVSKELLNESGSIAPSIRLSNVKVAGGK